MSDEIDWSTVDVQFEYQPSHEGDVFSPEKINEYEVVSIVYLGRQRPDLHNYIEEFLTSTKDR